MNFKLLAATVALLLLSGCASLSQYSPMYGCQGLAEFGCPDKEPEEDAALDPPSNDVSAEPL